MTMSRKRAILFAAFLAIFAAAAPSLALYSVGYRIDWEHKRVTKTGALFVKTPLSGVRVFVNGRPAGNTNLIFGHVLKENLLPRTYLVEARKEGYYSWQKRLAVQEGYTTSAKNILLFPRDPDMRTIASGIDRILFSQDRSRALLLPAASSERPAAWRTSSDAVADIPLHEPVLDASWSADGGIVAIRTAENLYAFAPFSPQHPCAGGCTLPPLPAPVAAFAMEPSGDAILAVAGENRALWRVPVSSASPQPLGMERVAALTKGNGTMFLLADSGIVFRVSAGPEPRLEQAGSFPPPSGSSTVLSSDAGGTLFLYTGAGAYVLDLAAQTPFALSRPSPLLTPSPGGGIAAFATPSELGLLYVRSSADQPAHAKGEEVFLTRFSERIMDLSWIGNRYLLLVRGGKAYAAEIDDRDSLNIVPLADADQAAWIPSDGTLVVRIGETVLRTSAPLVP